MLLRRLVFPAALALIFAASSAAVALAADQAALQKRFEEANAKFEAGEYQSAIEIYNEVLEADPTAGNGWVMRAIAKWNLKDKSGARADLAQAINLHPDNIDAYRVRGQFRYQAEDFQNSLDDFNKAVELVKMAVAALAAHAPDEARTFEKTNAEIYSMRAEVEHKLGSNQAALKDLTRAIELKPDYVAALYLRGQIHEAEQNPADAEKDYSKVIELYPKHADAFVNRAWIRFHDLKWDAAIADGKKALELAPKAALALRVVGYSQFGKGDYAEAAQTLAAAADADPTTSAAAYALFVRHHALLRTGDADKRLATSWGNWKDEPWLQALAKFLTGQIDEEALETVAKDTPDDGELAGRACEMHFYIGLARKQAGDKSTARLRFKSALGTDQKTYIEDALASAELKRL